MQDTYTLKVPKPAFQTLSKPWVIEFYAKNLSFPEYWSLNWDSFYACLSDSLDEMTSVRVVHTVRRIKPAALRTGKGNAENL